jgi:hypothetical protein
VVNLTGNRAAVLALGNACLLAGAYLLHSATKLAVIRIVAHACTA